MKNSYFAIILILLSIVNTGCMSAAFSGANLVYNHFEYEAMARNNLITLQAGNAINNDKILKRNSSVSISTFNYVVLLTGQVTHIKYRNQIVALVRKISGVKRVINAITVRSQTAVSQELKDAWITTKLKSKIIANKNLDAPEIKVVTENSIVYLMGHVTPKQAKIVIYLAKHTNGVREVVTIFRYIHLTDTPNE